ncbi:MAG: flagellar hook protein FlgE [Firmicutes bacterium]|nr:flagellar hook protein FlgE [Alicyclobacillaceae bacterium]MCL6497296.1 flagellar hook protein FlgE [Bacillota bacterium]
MSDSLYAAISGLNAEQQLLGVVSQNIANVNTVGYKASAVSFAEALQQTLQGAGAPTANQGGTNPEQVTAGGAVNVNAIDVNMGQGQIQSTGINTNLAIQGNGFFVVQMPQGNRAYTRAGDFTTDANGTLVDPEGHPVLGWMATNGTLPTENTANLAPIQIPQTLMPPAATTGVTVTGNLNAADAAGTVESVPVTIYDSLGTAIPVTLTFTAPSSGSTSWTVGATVPSGDSYTLSATSISFSGTNGTLNSGSSPITLTVTEANGNKVTATVDLSALTAYSAPTQLTATQTGGAAAGTLESFSINNQGEVVGTYSNGLTQTIGQIALAAFANPAGLTNIGNSLWQTSPNSGPSQIGAPNTGPRGSIQAGALEGSNVDLANEFVNMIIAQQGYQANAKVITVDQTLRQTLTNMVQ